VADNLALVLQLLLDESAKNKTIKGIKEVSAAITDDMDKFTADMTAQVVAQNAAAEAKDAAAKKASGGLDGQARRLKGQAEYAKKWADEQATLEASRATKQKARDEAAAKLEKETAQEAYNLMMEKRAILEEESAKKQDAADKDRANMNIHKEMTKTQWDFDMKALADKERLEREAAEKDKERSARRIQNRREAAKVEEQAAKAQADAQKAYTRQMREIRMLNRTASMVGQAGMALSVMGGAVTGGMYAAGNREAQRQKQLGAMTTETKKWLEAQQRIELSTQRMGRVAEATVLPYLEKAAALAERASKYLEAHPELAKTLLVAGGVALTLGTALTVALKGIRLYADLKYQAAQIANTAALEANTIAQGGVLAKNALTTIGGRTYGSEAAKLIGDGGSGGMSKVMKIAGSVTLLASAVILGAEIGAWLGNTVNKKIQGDNYKEQSIGDALKSYPEIWKRNLILPLGFAAIAAKKLGVFTDKQTAGVWNQITAFLKLDNASQDAAQALDEMTANLADEAEAMKIMVALEEENIAAQKKYAEDRAKIMEDAAQAVADSNKNLADNLRNIGLTLKNNLAAIARNLKDNLAQLASDFAESNVQAEQDYQKQRADIITASNEEIKKIHEQAQKDLEQLEKNHAQNVFNLTNARDALGLVDEQKAYEDRKNEINKAAQESVEQSRANAKAQLEEAAKNYEEQRAQRLAEYEKAKAESIAQAAKDKAEQLAQAAADKKEALEAAAQERIDIALQRAQDLADLKVAYDNERNARAVAAYNQIKELGGALQAEQLMRRQYNAAILADTEAHMKALQNVMSGLAGAFEGAKAGASGHSMAIGGYTSAGLYNMHAGEFVSNPATTKALESMVGGRLTQANILGAGGGSVVWNDNRRFDADVSMSTRKAITEDTIAVINDAMKKARRN
jgi:hypothetical protein